MDPLSITASVAGIAGACLATAKTLSDLRSKYKDAQMTIAAICAETTVIGTTLAKIQGILLNNPQALTAQIQAVPGLELQATFDIALTGCSVIYSCLDIEVQKLKAGASGADGPGWTEKAKFLWKETTMTDLLNHLQRQQGAITLLISVLQVETIADIHRLVREKDSTDVLESTAVNTRSLRAAYPQSKTPESIFDTEYDADARFRDTALVIGSSVFDFDSDVVNSQVYRRTLISARQYMQHSGGRSTDSGLLPDAESITEPNIDDTLLSHDSRGRFQIQKLPQGGQLKSISSTKALRYCSESVMGLWAMSTRRRFRTSELRFEVVYVTPLFFLAPPQNKRGPIHGREIYNIDGSDASYAETNTMKPDKERQRLYATADYERASWVTLLGVIQREEAHSREWERLYRRSYVGNKHEEPAYTICHFIQKVTSSYDFMPPTLTKPYATTNICHLVEMTAMLGMYWKVFDEIKGNLRAEGNSFMFTSSMVDGLGLVATFSVIGAARFKGNRVIPSHDIKDLVFGIVPCILGINLELGNVDSVKKTFARLKWESDLFDSWQAKKDRPWNLFPVTFELVGMLAIPIRIRGSGFTMLPNPTADRWPGYKSDIDWKEEMFEFQVSIEDATQSVNVHPLLVAINGEWQKIKRLWVLDIDIDVREQIHDAIDLVDKALQEQEEFSVHDIFNVVASHLKAVLNATDQKEATIDANFPANGKFVEYYLSDVLPDVEEDGLNLSEEQKGWRGVIWRAMMFRMICWFLLHDFDENDVNIVPSNLKGSRMPVFIS